jgi:hypothetical protein
VDGKNNGAFDPDTAAHFANSRRTFRRFFVIAERFQPPKEWIATGTGSATFTPTMPTRMLSVK